MERPEVRWTEHGPVPIEGEPAVVSDPPAAPPESPTDDLDAVRRRLAERGLLRQEPAVRILDVTEAPVRPVPEVAFAPDDRPTEVADDPADAAGLDQERVGPGSDVHCPKCRTRQQVADDASGFVCTSCATAWRWAVCSSCTTVALTFARQESWRCTSCGSSTRSWWRVATAPRDREVVRERRRDAAAAARRAAAYEKARRRRWKVLAAGTSVILVAVVAAVVITRRSSDEAARGSGARTCDLFLSANLTAEADPAGVRIALDELGAAASEAPDTIRLPAQRLASAGRPGDAAFETARTQLRLACR